jgi:hypothetical protein
MHPLGKSQAVDCSRHIDVREEQLNVGIRLEQFERLVTVHRLDHPETGIFKHANRREAKQRFIFNNENHGMRAVMIWQLLWFRWMVGEVVSSISASPERLPQGWRGADPNRPLIQPGIPRAKPPPAIASAGATGDRVFVAS